MHFYGIIYSSRTDNIHDGSVTMTFEEEIKRRIIDHGLGLGEDLIEYGKARAYKAWGISKKAKTVHKQNNQVDTSIHGNKDSESHSQRSIVNKEDKEKEKEEKIPKDNSQVKPSY